MRENVFGGHGLKTTAATISSEDVNASMASNSLMVHPWSSLRLCEETTWLRPGVSVFQFRKLPVRAGNGDEARPICLFDLFPAVAKLVARQSKKFRSARLVPVALRQRLLHKRGL